MRFLLAVLVAAALSGCAYSVRSERVLLDEQGRPVEVIRGEALIVVNYQPIGAGVLPKPRKYNTLALAGE